MKFHVHRTDIEHSPLNGVSAYQEAISAGALRLVNVQIDSSPGRGFKVGSVRGLDFSMLANGQVEELSGMSIKPRAFVLDEMTRHRETAQIFIPTTGPVLAAVIPDDGITEEPNPDLIRVVPVNLGEFVCIEVGTWHTLPFSLGGPVDIVNLVGASHDDNYHDIRDLPLLGWIAKFDWPDPLTQ
jgi:hypothetical protein